MKIKLLKNLIHNQKCRLLVKILLVILIFTFIIFSEKFRPPGPDSKLYYGLGKNLSKGIGYIDNVRNDEILPSIGYPFLTSIAIRIGINDGALFSRILLLLLCIFSLCCFQVIRLNFIIGLILLYFITLIIPVTSLWGIELALALITALLWLSIVLHIKYYDKWSGLFLGFCLFSHVLIRPLLMPLLYLFLIISIILMIRYSSFRLVNFLGVSLLIVLFASIYLYSNHRYNDNRLISGTYGDIPLYCAFNKFIPLTGRYSSKKWNKLPKDTKLKAIEPLKLPNGGWQERSATLKDKVKQFIISNPGKAISGYLWRLSKFTIFPITVAYRILFYSWIINVFIVIFQFFKTKKEYIKLGIIGIPIYIILVQSFFPFANERYYVLPGIFMLFSFAYLISEYKYFGTKHSPLKN